MRHDGWHDKKCCLGRLAGWHGKSGRKDPPTPPGAFSMQIQRVQSAGGIGGTVAQASEVALLCDDAGMTKNQNRRPALAPGG